MRSSGGRMYAGGVPHHGLVRSGSLSRAGGIGGVGGGLGGSQRSLVEMGLLEQRQAQQQQQQHQQLRAVTLKRASAQHALGFSVRGGRDVGFGIYVSKVEAGGGAERAGVAAGDRIVAVNGRSFENISQAEAIRILKSFVTLRLTLCATGRVPASTCVLHQTYTWVDRMGRRVSPPDDYEPTFHRSSSAWSLYGIGQSGKVRKVTLSLMEGESLGLMIRGGTEYGLGIYITGVDEQSAADRANLQIGDQILEANDASFVDITHDEAVRILKHSKHLVMKILDVGKIPFSCTMYDEMYWGVPGMDDDSLSGMSADDEMQSPCLVSTADLETLRILDEKAKLILTKREQSTLHYYRTEYDKGQVTLDALVAVLLELFNTPDKFSLLSEMRELIQVRDREKFDDLIYSRELEVKKACQKLGSSLENMVADRKADKMRRSSAADCYRYAAIDKFTGKIAQHNSCEQNNKDQCHFSCSSEAESRRRISSMFEGASRRGLSASTQALYWSGDPYGDMDARTPSEDSGVDLANGFHYGSRDLAPNGPPPSRRCSALDTIRVAELGRGRAERRRDWWARRRHSSGGEGSLDGRIEPPIRPTSSRTAVSDNSISSSSNDAYRAVPEAVQQPALAQRAAVRSKRRSTSRRYSNSNSSNGADAFQSPIAPTRPPAAHRSPTGLDPLATGAPLAEQPAPQRSPLSTHPRPTVVTCKDFIQEYKTLKPHEIPEEQQRITVPKIRSTLGIAIEGGADTRHLLPRIINIHPQGAAHLATGLKVGHVILAVDGQSVKGLSHRTVANLINAAFAESSRHEMEMIVGRTPKPTLEMRRSSIMPARDARRCEIQASDVRSASAGLQGSPRHHVQQQQQQQHQQQQRQQPSQQQQQQQMSQSGGQRSRFA